MSQPYSHLSLIGSVNPAHTREIGFSWTHFYCKTPLVIYPKRWQGDSFKAVICWYSTSHASSCPASSPRRRPWWARPTCLGPSGPSHTDPTPSGTAWLVRSQRRARWRRCRGWFRWRQARRRSRRPRMPSWRPLLLQRAALGQTQGWVTSFPESSTGWWAILQLIRMVGWAWAEKPYMIPKPVSIIIWQEILNSKFTSPCI